MSLDTIVRVMGGEDNIGRNIKSPLDFIKASREGKISVRIVKVIQDRAHLTNYRMARILNVSETTLQRIKKMQDSNLGEAESDAVYDVSKVIAKGIEVFENEDDFNEWLNTRNTALGNERPVDLLHSSIGREQIINVLNALAHGIYS
ncbi:MULTISPECIES: type II RES/Xre toxin-antitoxin system antitoxin [Pontibacter]|uniref:Uncharacterized protein n=1 Tax=Pontibacter actiniarum TaxID=323450 RepID=A0A1X9YZ74_9BACT|nr:antitoxin Xre/MbcA/ParS toxin-binding domain-containing protein [Pontibacter actiniarum]ARS38103.1 hypothetical protein CA264_21390 [Pontibacter actiniarum]